MSGQMDFTVLAIDDSRINCALIRKVLSAAGYRVHLAQSGPQGRRLAAELRPHLILLDIEMPGEDGFATISKLKENHDTAAIPVIFLSGVSDVESKVMGFELGAVDFITKPFEAAEIRARTKLHIKMSMAMRALIEQQKDKLRQLGDAQQKMLVAPEEIPEARFSVLYRSLNEAGGDFYSVTRISEDVYGYFVGDVSGHDLSTSYITAAINVLLKQNCSPLYTPGESMRMINSVLCQTLEARKFLAATYLQIDRRNMRATLINMGNPPVLFVPLKGRERFITVRAAPLGMFAASFFDSYEFPVSTGDRLFMYSDGLLETSGQVWSVEMWRLPQAAATLRGGDLAGDIGRLRDYFIIDEDELKDDLVILGTEV